MENQIEDLCPHLGRKRDPLTIVHYPSHRNVCHHVREALTPNFEHQRTACLTPHYIDCRVYNDPEPKKGPKDIFLQRSHLRIAPRKAVLITLLVLLVIALLLALIYFL